MQYGTILQAYLLLLLVSGKNSTTTVAMGISESKIGNLTLDSRKTGKIMHLKIEYYDNQLQIKPFIHIFTQYIITTI